jgi:hypothetical protein
MPARHPRAPQGGDRGHRTRRIVPQASIAPRPPAGRMIDRRPLPSPEPPP